MAALNCVNLVNTHKSRLIILAFCPIIFQRGRGKINSESISGGPSVTLEHSECVFVCCVYLGKAMCMDGCKCSSVHMKHGATVCV